MYIIEFVFLVSARPLPMNVRHKQSRFPLMETEAPQCLFVLVYDRDEFVLDQTANYAHHVVEKNFDLVGKWLELNLK